MINPDVISFVMAEFMKKRLGANGFSTVSMPNSNDVSDIIEGFLSWAQKNNKNYDLTDVTERKDVSSKR